MRIFGLWLVILCVWAGAAQAAPKNAPLPGPEIIKQTEDYFARLNTVKARFVQTAPDGTQRVGTFYLSRPGKLRFEYDPPVADLVVADAIQLYFYDGELKQTSSAPVGQTLADFLVRRDIKLSKDITVTGLAEGGGLVQINLTQTADPGAGTMTLGFTRQPWALKKWRIIDGQGQITEVELFDMQSNIALPNSLFVFRDPKNPNGKYNQ